MPTNNAEWPLACRPARPRKPAGFSGVTTPEMTMSDKVEAARMGTDARHLAKIVASRIRDGALNGTVDLSAIMTLDQLLAAALRECAALEPDGGPKGSTPLDIATHEPPLEKVGSSDSTLQFMGRKYAMWERLLRIVSQVLPPDDLIEVRDWLRDAETMSCDMAELVRVHREGGTDVWDATKRDLIAAVLDKYPEQR